MNEPHHYKIELPEHDCLYESTNEQVYIDLEPAYRKSTVLRLLEADRQRRGGEPVAYRLLRKNADGDWVTDGRRWCDGIPDGDLVRDVAKSGQYRFEYAYAAPQPAETGREVEK